MRSDITASDRTNRNVFTEKLPFFLFFFFFNFTFLSLLLSLLYIYYNSRKFRKRCQVLEAKRNRSIEDRFHPCIECIEFSKSKVKEIEMKVMVGNVTLFTRGRMEKHSRHPSLQGSIQGRRGKARDRDGSMNFEGYLYQRVERTERGKRSSILENKKPSKR